MAIYGVINTAAAGDTRYQGFVKAAANFAILEGAKAVTTVASHATTAAIWTAAGDFINWTGTATTTAFPAAGQAGMCKILICAGAAVFTAGTNMLIDGIASGSSMTCAAGDRVVVIAVATTQFKLSRIKYDGTAQVLAGDHIVTVTTGNGWGSGSTAIRRFTTEEVNTGAAITYADSASLGATFTINTAGLYEIHYIEIYATGATYFGISKNSSQLTTAIQSITAATNLIFHATVAGFYGPVTGVFSFAAGDVIRPHGGGSNLVDSNALTKFSIRRIGYL